jgi:hypothetical protein
MFIRVRKSKKRLRLSLVETCRVNGQGACRARRKPWLDSYRDAGLKKPFSYDDPAYRAAFAKMGRIAGCKYLVPEAGQPSAVAGSSYEVP